MRVVQTNLVEDDATNLSTDVDSRRTDAKDACFLQPVLGVNCADSECCRKRGRDDNRDDVKRAQYNLLCCNLQTRSLGSTQFFQTYTVVDLSRHIPLL